MINRRYDPDFLMYLIGQAIKSLNIHNVPSIKKKDSGGDALFPLFEVNVKAAYLDFAICETIDDGAVQYYALIVRETSGSRDNPPDTEEWETEIHRHPSAAIREAILKCVEEAIDSKCYDEIAYAEWKGEANGQ